MHAHATETELKTLNPIAAHVVESAFRVHSALGPGLLEGVYEACLVHELIKRGLRIQRQVALPIEYEGVRLDGGLRLDIVINNSVIAELKAVDKKVRDTVTEAAEFAQAGPEPDPSELWTDVYRA